jgi:hypothetical protein
VWPWGSLLHLMELLGCESQLTSRTPIISSAEINWDRVDSSGLVAGAWRRALTLLPTRR